MYYVYGHYDGITIWASLHRGDVVWTDHKPDAEQFSETSANSIKAKAPAWLTNVRVIPLMNYLGVTWKRPERHA